MDTLSLILIIALGFALLYMLFILGKFALLACCDSPENEKELLERFRADFPDRKIISPLLQDSEAIVEFTKEKKTRSNLERSYGPKPSSIMPTEKLQPDINTNKMQHPQPKPRPLSPLEPVVVVPYQEAWRKKVETTNNIGLLRQHGERQMNPLQQGSILTLDHRPCQVSGPPVGLSDSGFSGKLYPSESFQTLDEFPDSLSFRGRSLDQPDTLAADSSLVIGTAASNGKIVGYCVNLVRRKCSFYSYETGQISLKDFFSPVLQQQKQCEVLPMENLYFATLLWYKKIQKYQSFRLHSNHQIDSSENERSSSRQYNSYGIPAVYLLNNDYRRFQAIINDAFQVENFQGTHKLQASGGAEVYGITAEYNTFLNKVQSSLETNRCGCFSTTLQRKH
ncbi:unnamed protein product [Allacma fusca]|uniref:Uncharacterized protein n=1 Tax=Allacma fusca TaxID=39272 RepID=A0A8J2KC40_9HEXA|nr:unnamed protein product [Allacma fusca]